jgi:type IV pilus assembly protein PilB
MKFDFATQQKKLQSLRDRESEMLSMRFAQSIEIPYIDLTTTTISTDALSLVPEILVQDASLAPFKLIGQELSVACVNPQLQKTKEILGFLEEKNYKITLFICSEKSLRKATSRFEDVKLASNQHGSFIDISDESLQSIADKVSVIHDVTPLLENCFKEEGEKKTSRIMEVMMGSAIKLGCSDIHVEPFEHEAHLRFRLDGMLETVSVLPIIHCKSIVSRIKILSKMKININKVGQDGRFTINFKQTQIEVRVSVVPSSYGESVVMRILDPQNINVGLETIGIEPYLLEILKKEIAKPSGLILNTGPTGSGKTTTLYSLIKYVFSPDIKIFTVEDPIEYHLDGISQSPVDQEAGFNFLDGIKHAMRQDPDIILVGEIRDHETALAAMQAAQTGHLVFSTLHTNSAAGVIPRLMDLDINAATLAQSLSCCLAQRLVRKLTSSKVPIELTPEQEFILRANIKRASGNGKDMSRFGLSWHSDFVAYGPGITDQFPSGYKGRLGIFEAVLMTHAIKEALEDKPSERVVKKLGDSQNILTLAEDASVKVMLGITSYSEVEEVVNLEEDIEEMMTKFRKKEITLESFLKEGEITQEEAKKIVFKQKST